MDTITQIENAEIAEAIVRTAYSRIYDCLAVLKDQSVDQSVNEVKLAQPTQARLVNMLVQDFSCANDPCHGAVPLRHADPKDKERDLEVAAYFNQLAPALKQAVARSALTEMVGNFNKSPAARDVQFKL